MARSAPRICQVPLPRLISSGTLPSLPERPAKRPATPFRPKSPVSEARSNRFAASRTAKPEAAKLGPARPKRRRLPATLSGDAPSVPAKRGERSSAPPATRPPGAFQIKARPVGQSGSEVRPRTRRPTRRASNRAGVQRSPKAKPPRPSIRPAIGSTRPLTQPSPTGPSIVATVSIRVSPPGPAVKRCRRARAANCRPASAGSGRCPGPALRPGADRG
jgi:hypothetical protein